MSRGADRYRPRAHTRYGRNTPLGQYSRMRRNACGLAAVTAAESIARMNWTRRWWSEFAAQSMLVSSSTVIAALRRGTSQTTGEWIAPLKNAALLETTRQVDDVARVYIDKLVMPNDPGGDALQFALATIHRVDVLLTWNCRHLANPSNMEHVRVVNYELGLPMPLLTTPLNYLSGDEPDAER